MAARTPSLVLAVFVFLIPYGGSAGAAAASTETVAMRNFEFQPERSSIRPGDRIRWTYEEDALDPRPNCESPYLQIEGFVECPGHSATAVARGRNGKPLFDTGVYRAEGFPQTFPFKHPGVFRYYCIVHGGDNASPLTSMNGVVIVEPSRRQVVTDGDDVAGPIDLRALSATRTGDGGLVVTVTSWHGWASSALSAKGRRLDVLFDVDTDGASGDADATARVLWTKGRLLVNFRDGDEKSVLNARRIGTTGVRFTVPASASPASTDADHQLAATTAGPADRVPAFPGWLPLPAA